MKRYNPKELEPKWQKIWSDKKLYKAVDFDTTRPKYVMLTEFPYPSGDGLHLGHVREYTLGDIMARYKRMTGHNVLYPMGYDAFGLPTENYAIKNKIAPQVATDQNVGNFQKQFDSLGYSIDWDRSFRTTDPSYYKWTQWLFLQFFKAGLAYQAETTINWCPKCKTGLANEEVVNGRHERCDTLVEKKTLKQWLLKITDYADRLIDGLQDVDYPSRIADQQINWIGRSKGAEIDFAMSEESNFVLLHGFTGSSKNNFFPWLKEELELLGKKAFVPDMPSTNRPDANQQAEYVLKNANFDENTVLLGHSYGSVTALKIIEQLKKPIKRLVLVAGFAEPGFLDKERNFEKTTNWNFDFEKIKNNVQEIVILRAQNDSAVPQERSDYLRSKLGGIIVDFTAQEDHVCGKVEPVVLSNLTDTIKVFTTRPDTLFGATFMVLAPEHPLVEKITTLEQKAAVNTYKKAAQAKSEIERQETDREKTGVFTGAYVTNPVNNEKIPVWIADYVLAGYGTGAIMAVPAHDDRDNEFAKKFDIPIKQVVAEQFIHVDNNHRSDVPIVSRNVVSLVVEHPEDGTFLIAKPTNSDFWAPVMGGIEKGESPQDAATRELLEESGYDDIKEITVFDEILASEFYAQHKKENRIAYINSVRIKLGSLRQKPVSEEEKQQQTLEWVNWDVVSKRCIGAGAEEIFAMARGEKKPLSLEGRIINSDKYNGMNSSEMREKIVKDLETNGLAKEKTTYKLRDWIFSRQHYWGEPIPIIHCEKCGAVPVPDDQLPVELPPVDHYEPTDTGESPLALITDWVNVSCPTCGGKAKRETDTMPNWAGSSWYYLRYFDAHNDNAFADKKKLEYWGMVDMYLGGMEHTTLHLLYSRFWHQFFYDQGLVPTPEPYYSRRGQGIILAADGNKMSKSKGNVVNPTDIIDSGYGADALRTSIAFIAPYDQTTPWSPEGVAGTHRFVARIWTLVQEYLSADKKGSEKSSKDLLIATHKTIAKVSSDLHTMGFNTAVAALMEFVNSLYKIKSQDNFASKDWDEVVKTLLQLTAPFAPHITEELWQQLGQQSSVHTSEWPVHDKKYLTSDTTTIVVQVNGKVRANIYLPLDSDEKTTIQAAQDDKKVAEYLKDKEIRKTIYVPHKLVNFVVV